MSASQLTVLTVLSIAAVDMPEAQEVKVGHVGCRDKALVTGGLHRTMALEAVMKVCPPVLDPHELDFPLPTVSHILAWNS